MHLNLPITIRQIILLESLQQSPTLLSPDRVSLCLQLVENVVDAGHDILLGEQDFFVDYFGEFDTGEDVLGTGFLLLRVEFGWG